MLRPISMRLHTATLARGSEWRSRRIEWVSRLCHVTVDLSLSGTVQMLPADAQTLMLSVLSLCAVVAPTNSSPVIPAIANSPPHRARHAHHPFIFGQYSDLLRVETNLVWGSLQLTTALVRRGARIGRNSKAFAVIRSVSSAMSESKPTL
jgi:hypothetical protein